MSQWHYKRDIWALGPPQQKPSYPGAFPRGLLSRLKKNGWWGEKRLWLFSGSFRDPTGTTVDINPAVKANYIANCEELPFVDEAFDFVMLDPPYSEKEALELYNMPYFNIVKVMNKAARVCKAGGFVVLLHRLIPSHHPQENSHKKRLKLEAIIGVFTIAGYSNIRALVVWRKMQSIENVCNSKLKVVGAGVVDTGGGNRDGKGMVRAQPSTSPEICQLPQPTAISNSAGGGGRPATRPGDSGDMK